MSQEVARTEIDERRAAFEALAAAGLHERAEAEMAELDELERAASRETKARDLLEWNEKLPESVRVVDTTPEGHATRLFSVVTDYGWAERIVCEGSYQQDAEMIAAAIREACAIP